MDSNGFNLERKINEFLENFNQNANSALDDGDVLYGDGLTRSRSKYMMDDELEMSGRMTRHSRYMTSIPSSSFIVLDSAENRRVSH